MRNGRRPQTGNVMRLKLMTAGTTCAVLLLASLTVLWVRSYVIGDVLYVMITRVDTATDTTINIGSRRGALYLVDTTDMFRSIGPVSREVRWGHEPIDADAYPGQSSWWRDAQFNAGGFVFLRRIYRFPARVDAERARTQASHFGLVVPYWAVTLVTGIPAALLASCWRRQARRRSRLRRGLCLRCGYDLRAAVGERCPECGEATPRPREMASDSPARPKS